VHEESAPTGGEVSGTVLGVLAGYNFFYPQAAPWLLGIEADAGWANVHGSGVSVIVLDSCPDYTYDLHWDAHLRLKASYPEGGAVAPFLAAGLALANLDITDAGEAQKGGLFFGG